MIRLALAALVVVLVTSTNSVLLAQGEPDSRPTSRPTSRPLPASLSGLTQEERRAHLDLVIPKHDEASIRKDEVSGVTWSWLKRGPEKAAKLRVGDKLRVHMTIWLAADGTEVSTSRRREGKGSTPENFDSGAFLRGLNVVTPHLRPGDKVRIDLPAAMAFGEKGMRQRIPPNSDLIYALQILRVEGHVDVPEFGRWDDEKASTLESGSAYMILEDGEGVMAGDKAGVAFDYVLRDDKGNIIDSSMFSRKAPLGGQVGRFGPDFLNVIGQLARSGGHYLARAPIKMIFPGEVALNVDPGSKYLFFDLLAREIAPFVYADDDKMIKADNGLEYLVIREGEGEKVKPEDRVHIHYAYWTLPDGKLFDASYTRGITNNFKQVGLTPGMRQALAKIAPGGVVRARIPARLAWGAAGRVGVPGNTEILLHIELFPQDASRNHPRRKLGEGGKKKGQGKKDGDRK